MLGVTNEVFGPDVIVNALSSAAPFPTPLLDLIVPPSKWDTHDDAVIGVDCSAGSVVNQPVIHPGAPAVSVDPDNMSVKLFRPACLDLVSTMHASDIMRLRGVYGDSLAGAYQKEVNKRLAKLRDSMRATRQAMLSQALKGSYAYPKKNSGGQILTDSMTFGTVVDPDAYSGYLDSTPALSDLETFWDYALSGIRTASNNQFGNDPLACVALCPSGVWSALVSLLASSFPNNPPMPFYENGLMKIRVGVMTFVYAGWNYKTVTTNGALTDTPFITAKYWTVIDLNGNHFGRYLPVDDIEAGLQAVEFYAKSDVSHNPSKVDILAKQTPFVFADVRAIATDQVLA